MAARVPITHCTAPVAMASHARYRSAGGNAAVSTATSPVQPPVCDPLPANLRRPSASNSRIMASVSRASGSTTTAACPAISDSAAIHASALAARRIPGNGSTMKEANAVPCNADRRSRIPASYEPANRSNVDPAGCPNRWTMPPARWNGTTKRCSFSTFATRGGIARRRILARVPPYASAMAAISRRNDSDTRTPPTNTRST